MLNLSIIKEQIQDKPVAVFGLGVSGLSSVKALVAANINVTAFDDNKNNCEKAKSLGAAIQDLTKIDLSSYAFLLLSPGVAYSFEPHQVVQNAQKYNLEIIGDIELLHRTHHSLRTIGITGTNGKSTTTALITHVLNECGCKATMAGNIGVPVCDVDLSQFNQGDFLVLEMSSYQIDLCPTFSPDIAILLNITPDHLDRHGSMKNYVEAKARLFHGQGRAIICIDDDFTNKIFDDVFCHGERIVTPVSARMEIPEGIYVSDHILYLNNRGENQSITDLSSVMPLKGKHNYQNMACVFAALKMVLPDHQKIIEAFQHYPGLPHRQYKVGSIEDIAFINDSKATNAEAAAKALAAYDHIFWIVGGQAKETGLEGLEIFNNKVIRSYIIGESALEFGIWMTQHQFEHRQCQTLEVAIDKAYEDAASLSIENATILLSPACASWDQFSSFEERGEFFEKKFKELLNHQKSDVA